MHYAVAGRNPCTFMDSIGYFDIATMQRCTTVLTLHKHIHERGLSGIP
jgi:hypothetical protein